MKAFKSYLKGGSKPATNDEPAAQMTEIPTQLTPPSLAGSRRLTVQSTNSFQTVTSLRDPQAVKGMKADVMTEWLYKQQRLKLWASSGPEEGIILKRDRGEYTCCPEDLRRVRGGLFDEIVNMNVRVRISLR
jgi:hypothetical protein